MPYNEHHHLQIRFDAFNAFNHTDFANPGIAGTKYIDQGGFGQITGTNAATTPRQLQLAARYTFYEFVNTGIFLQIGSFSQYGLGCPFGHSLVTILRQVILFACLR